MQQELAAAAIRSAGRRLTPQRMLVLEAVGALGGHVPVERIAARVQEQAPQVDLATVYRTVALLSRLHLLNEVQVGGVSHYEATDPARRHGHMVCEHCSATFHLPPGYLDGLRSRLLTDTGFELHPEHVTLSGLCPECRADEQHSHSGHTHTGASSHSHPNPEA
ncbi:MAG: Fur family transcriptional regulator [Chloroflexota bacterium]